MTLFASRYILPETLFPWINLVAALLVVGVGWALWAGRGRDARRPAGARALTRTTAPEPVLAGVAAATTTATTTHHDHAHPTTAATPRTTTITTTGRGATPTRRREDLSVRSLMAVGASAGIIPCPSALVLLLGAIALDRVGYGLVLVWPSRVGLAGLLSVIGLLVLYARRFVDRLPLDGRLMAAAPAVSALIIVALGIVLTARALPGVL